MPYLHNSPLKVQSLTLPGAPVSEVTQISYFWIDLDICDIVEQEEKMLNSCLISGRYDNRWRKKGNQNDLKCQKKTIL